MKSLFASQGIAKGACLGTILDYRTPGNGAKEFSTSVEDSTVRAVVSLIEEDQGTYRRAARCMRDSLQTLARKLNT